MLSPIELYNKTTLTTGEIGIIGSNWLLTGELEPAQTAVAQVRP